MGRRTSELMLIVSPKSSIKVLETFSDLEPPDGFGKQQVEADLLNLAPSLLDELLGSNHRVSHNDFLEARAANPVRGLP